MDEITARFLSPTHALPAPPGPEWPWRGFAETPGEDACCRLFLRCDAAGRMQMAFAAFGPPVVVACADWLCARVQGQTPASARRIDAGDVEEALALAPTQRYAGVLVIDAFANALVNLEQ